MPTKAKVEHEGRLNLMEYSDYDLLHYVDDHPGQTTEALAELLERATRSVGSRFSWMKRQGLLVRDTKNRWLVARRGRILLETRGEAIHEIQRLAAQIGNDTVAGWVARREWKRNLK